MALLNHEFASLGIGLFPERADKGDHSGAASPDPFGVQDDGTNRSGSPGLGPAGDFRPLKLKRTSAVAAGRQEIFTASLHSGSAFA